MLLVNIPTRIVLPHSFLGPKGEQFALNGIFKISSNGSTMQMIIPGQNCLLGLVSWCSLDAIGHHMIWCCCYFHQNSFNKLIWIFVAIKCPWIFYNLFWSNLNIVEKLRANWIFWATFNRLIVWEYFETLNCKRDY